MARAVLGCFVLMAALPIARAQTPLPTLITAAQVRALSREQAQRHHPVKLRGVVTHFAAPLAYLQDETGAVYFSPGNSFHGAIPKVEPGDLVEIEGVTSEGQFAPIVQMPSGGLEPVKVTVLGKAPLPEAIAFSLADKMNLDQHSRYAKLRGVVRAVFFAPRPGANSDPRLQLWISRVDGEVRALVSRSVEADLAKVKTWIGEEVEVRGVRAVTFTTDRSFKDVMLAVQTIADITPDLTAVENAFGGPARPLHTLGQFEAGTSGERRVQVRGRVTLTQPGRGVFLAGDESEPLAAIFAATTQRDLPEIGTLVAAAGFPGMEIGGAILRDAVLRTRGGPAVVESVTVTAQQALGGARHRLFVQIDATLLSAAHHGPRKIFSLSADGVLFSAEVAQAKSAQIPPGSRLRVAGVCWNEWSGDSAATPTSFNLLLRQPADVRVLARPPFWTGPRIAAALGGLLALLLGALAWAVTLRRRVTEQTDIIKVQMQRETLSGERRRVARELHDTLEQEMTGLALQLASASEFIEGENEPASRSLDMASGMLERSREEMRMAIWELRDPLLEQGLVGAVRGLPQRFTFPAEVVVRIDVEGAAARLPIGTESQLYRIAQEAVTNALKHAAAHTIAVRLSFQPGAVTLEVTDDGRGFEVSEAAALLGGHFGLLGMRERVEKIGASLAVESAPGKGTRIAVTLPLGSPTAIGAKYTLG